MPGQRDDGARPERVVVAFDLDGTLVRGDSFRSFMRTMLFRGPLRSLATLLASTVLWPMFLFPPTRELSVHGYLWIAAGRVSPARFDELAAEFARSHAAAAGGNQIAATLERLRAHIDAGEQVVIVTGSPDPVASAICSVLGLEGIPVVAARLTPTTAGRLRYEPCIGETKLVRLREAGYPPPFGHAYTDSHTDLPLLLASAQRYVVAPRSRALRRIRRRLPDSVVIR